MGTRRGGEKAAIAAEKSLCGSARQTYMDINIRK
jgi:hypothetical protein